jgi:hypothetical protein
MNRRNDRGRPLRQGTVNRSCDRELLFDIISYLYFGMPTNNQYNALANFQQPITVIIMRRLSLSLMIVIMMIGGKGWMSMKWQLRCCASVC